MIRLYNYNTGYYKEYYVNQKIWELKSLFSCSVRVKVSLRGKRKQAFLCNSTQWKKCLHLHHFFDLFHHYSFFLHAYVKGFLVKKYLRVISRDFGYTPNLIYTMFDNRNAYLMVWLSQFVKMLLSKRFFYKKLIANFSLVLMSY